MHDDEQTTPATPAERTGGLGRRILSATLALLFVVFAGGGLFFGYIFATTALDLLAAPAPSSVDVPPSTANQPSQEPVASSPGTPVPAAASGTPAPAKGIPVPASPPTVGVPAATPTPAFSLPEYRGKGRVTVLLLGLDLREADTDKATRTDTMILVTVDPVTKKAGMLSIPRDLWVAIPGHGENKINTAHYFGEMDKPGSGPEVARKTVELNFGVHVQYWARIDFTGFERLIDAVGGVTVDAYRAIKDDLYPAENNGIRRVYIPTGLQHLSGAEALWFARSRHSDNDFGRGARQRQVLLAARQRLIQPSVIPKIPQLISIGSSTVETNVPLIEYLPLLNLARQVNTDDIVSRSIEYSMTIDLHNDGTILVPKRQEVRAVIDEVFGVTPPATPTPTPRASAKPTAAATPAAAVSPAAAVTTPSTTPAAPTQQITLNLQNGTDRNGLAAGWAERLRTAGYVIGQVKQAERSFGQTTILDHTGRTGAARALIQALGLADAVVERSLPAENGADLTVILGRDVRTP